MEVRIVEAGRGWQWIIGGVLLFRKSPLMWAVLVAILYVALKVLMRISLLGLVAILLLPIFLVGLMEGCKALERGNPLQIGHLLSGFRTNAAPLITLGGISLVGNLLIAIVIQGIGGDAMVTIMKYAGQTTIAPDAVEIVRQAMSKAMLAAAVGAALSLPLMMALWFAPLLVWFHGMKPLQAIVHSFWACWKNLLPFLVYGLIVLAAMIMVMPVGLATRQIDLGLWILGPILIPTIYTSYRDLFVPTNEKMPIESNEPFSQDTPPNSQEMVRCEVCHTFVPASEAILDRGNTFCSEEHRRQFFKEN